MKYNSDMLRLLHRKVSAKRKPGAKARNTAIDEVLAVLEEAGFAPDASIFADEMDRLSTEGVRDQRREFIAAALTGLLANPKNAEARRAGTKRGQSSTAMLIARAETIGTALALYNQAMVTGNAQPFPGAAE